MKKIIILIIFAAFSIHGITQEIAAYKLYDGKGNEIQFKDIVELVSNADIVLFGELHNNPISHWMKYELIDHVSEDHDVILGAEMFEADDQEHLTRYLEGEINIKQLDSLARLWPNYYTDYAGIVELAKTKNIDFIATNIPRSFARLVNRFGFEALDTLSKEDKKFIAPLPIEYDPDLPGYRKMLEMGESFGHMMTSENFPKAQAIKDATMAHFILQNFTGQEIFIHINGSYHSDNYEGILWYLKNEEKDLKYITISTVLQDDVFNLREDFLNIADIILVVNRNVTTSY